jgi:TRAP-type C4-dicarboxylate transport system permease small subunit
MKYSIKSILKNLDEIVAGICIIATTTIVLVNVFTRYLLNTGIYWTEEVSTGLFVWAVFIGSAAAYKKHMHVGVDMVVKRLPPRGKFITKIIVDFLLILINGYITQMTFTYLSISYKKVTPVLELSSAWISGSILISFILITIYSIYFFIYDIRHIEEIEGGKF